MTYTIEEVITKVGLPVYIVTSSGFEYIVTGYDAFGYVCNSCYDNKNNIEYNDFEGWVPENRIVIDYEPLASVKLETLIINRQCDCDFVTIILPYGCQCGGK